MVPPQISTSYSLETVSLLSYTANSCVDVVEVRARDGEVILLSSMQSQEFL